MGCTSRNVSQSDGIPFISLSSNRLQNSLQMLRAKMDVLLTIDYRSNYRGVFNALPFTPIITWVRDPRTPADIKKSSLKIPGKENIKSAGISATSIEGLVKYHKRPFAFKNSVTLANKMLHMKGINFEV